MNPERKTEINGHKVEEYYWAGRMVTYVDNRLSEDGYDNAVDRLVESQARSKERHMGGGRDNG